MSDRNLDEVGNEPCIPEKSAIMSYDDVLRHLGEFGRFQKRIYFLLCLAVIPCALHKLAGVFLGARPDYRCKLPFETENATYKDISGLENMTLVWDKFAGTWSSCQKQVANFTEDYFVAGVPSTVYEDCDSWIFDKSKYTSSSVIEFLLICNRAWLRATADALFMTGVLVGSYIFGDLSDRFGRRPTFFICLVIQLVGGILTSIAPEYISFVLGRILIGATTSGVFLVAYVIAMEMVGPSKRLFAGVIVHMFFSVTFLYIAVVAYLTREYSWRIFQVTITLVPGLFFMSYWWVIPESSRWLLTKGRTKEAKEILMKAAKENGVKLDAEMIDGLLLPSIEQSKGTDGEIINSEKPSLLSLMKYPNLRKRSIIIFILWFVCSLAYYGLSWSTSELGGNDYFNLCLSGLVEFPGYSILLLCLNRYGRKFTQCGSLIFGGVALLLTTFVPAELNWLNIILAMLGKMAITSAYGTVYVFSTEQFPTVIRNVALGAASMSARVGGIICPYINLLAEYWKPLPLIIFGGLALVAGGTALLLPETKNCTLPETIEDGEKFKGTTSTRR